MSMKTTTLNKSLPLFGALPASMFLSRDGGRLQPAQGMEAYPLKALGLIPGIGGGDRGFNAQGDVVTETLDGVSLNDLWKDYQDMLASFNAKRDVLLNFLTWRTTKAKEDDINRNGALVDFEESTEYGEPVGVRPRIPDAQSLGYTMKWYDVAARFTWQFLANADSTQVDTIADQVAEADNRLVFQKVMTTVFNPVRRMNKEGLTVFPFYSGAAGDLPPAVGSTTFADSHQHYVTTNSATLTPAHLEALQTLVTEHGYNKANGYQLIALINDGDTTENRIRQFRSIANTLDGNANATHGNFDFVPAAGTSPLLLPTDVRLSDNGVVRPPSSIGGMDVVGAYGEMVFVKNAFIPAGYIVLFVTGGELNILNPVAIREHPNAGLRGLRLVKGKTPDYPLIDSFWNRGFGTGVRRRGAGAVMQIVASASYTAPAAYNTF
jgi:hypothetical protein